MYTRKLFPFHKLLVWTSREILFFTLVVTAITILFETLNIKWLQIPLTPVGLIGTAVAFMIGFQNNAAYDRIWEARKIWGGIVNTSRTLIIILKDSFYYNKKEDIKEQKDILKKITYRHIAWLNALRYAMRTKKEWETNYNTKAYKKLGQWVVPEHNEDLQSQLKPYLSEYEFNKVMKTKNKTNAIIALQSAHFRTLTDEKILRYFTFLKLQDILQELTALQGKSERIKNFPYPKQYGSIGYHFVHIFVWLVPLSIIPHFEKMGNEIAKINPFVGEYFVWLNIPCTVIVIWVFNTMLRIGLAGENPFEGSPNDVPISNISRGISRDILQIIDEDEDNLPPLIKNKNHVQM